VATIRRQDDALSIGRPIPNTQIYLLNSYLQPVPLGIAGELYIGGVGLARGYFNRPDLTAEKFLPHPFCTDPDARLYRTGDLARYRSDGSIEFLGRIDHQVKINGFRIELGEVEVALGTYAAVSQCVVIAREDALAGKRLVAYLVATAGQRPTATELRRYLSAKLPSYLIPAAFVLLDALPLTPNGKLDRRALPAPATPPTEQHPAHAMPRGPVEKQLAQIWAEVLNVTSVSIHDNFFDLGGASIQSLEIIAKAQQLGLPITPELLFRHQTIAELAPELG